MIADWARGVWTAGTTGEIVRPEGSGERKAAANKAARLTIGSDWLPLRGYEIKSGEDPLAVYGDLLPLLRNSDVNIRDGD